MDNTNPALLAKLAELQTQYGELLPAKLEELRELWRAALQASNDANVMGEVVRHCHALAGSGTTFGFPEITRVARLMENTLRPVAEEGESPDGETVNQIDSLLETLETAARSGMQAATTVPSFGSHALEISSNETRPIYVVDGDDQARQKLVKQLRQYRFEIKELATLAALKQAVQEVTPAAVIVDIDLDDIDAISTIHDLERIRGTRLLTLVTSHDDSLEKRLRAVRTVMADAFFTKPVDINVLIDTIDNLSHQDIHEPYRVMIVDDDQQLAEFTCVLLEENGMRCERVSDLNSILQAIETFSPELLLADVYMPDFSGLELAAVIRQHPAYVGFPIVFISTETDAEKQLTAMSYGADDFISKPLNAEHLVATITNRIERHRRLNSLMVHDTLTGLCNHTTIRERLETELNRAVRDQLPFCYAMLDIDDFKQLNEEFGHAAGDYLLKTFARTLSHRFRKQDGLGRYGGEEFAIIMPNTKIANAVKVIDEIRDDFSKTIHKFGDNLLSCSFSAGVAQFPDFETVASIHDAAERALQAAKQQGRNRIVQERPAIANSNN